MVSKIKLWFHKHYLDIMIVIFCTSLILSVSVILYVTLKDIVDDDKLLSLVCYVNILILSFIGLVSCMVSLAQKDMSKDIIKIVEGKDID